MVVECVGWQPHLAQVRVWGWVGMHTGDTLTNQCTQVEPAISTHTLGALGCSIFTTSVNIITNQISHHPVCVLCRRSPEKPREWHVAVS